MEEHLIIKAEVLQIQGDQELNLKKVKSRGITGLTRSHKDDVLNAGNDAIETLTNKTFLCFDCK